MSNVNNEIKGDNVCHPKHYTNCSLECIDVMEVILGTEPTAYFCLANAFKYMWRFRHKNGEEDVKKARWYLDWIEHRIDLGYEFSDEFLRVYRRVTNLCISITDKIANREVTFDA